MRLNLVAGDWKDAAGRRQTVTTEKGPNQIVRHKMCRETETPVKSH